MATAQVNRPFIPLDKPKFWVVGVVAGLVGLAAGVIAFAAAWFEVIPVKAVFSFVLVTCWLTFAIAWLGFMFGNLTGKYRNIEERPWREQVW